MVPEGQEGVERAGVFFLDAALLVGSADGAVVAPTAGIGARGGGEEAFLKGVVDGLEGGGGAAAGLGAKADRDGAASAALGGVEQDAGLDRGSEEAFDSEAVEGGLQLFAVADGDGRRVGGLAGLVVGDAQDAGEAVALDEVDAAAEADAVEDEGGAGDAGGVVELVIGEAEGELEVDGEPLGVEGGELEDPAAEVGAELLDGGAPDLFDGRGEFLAVALGDQVQGAVGAVEDFGEVLGGDGEEPGGLEVAEQFVLGVVKELAAIERIELLDGDGGIAGPELVDGVEEELVGAGCILLEGGRGIGAGDEAVGGEEAERFGIGADEAVGLEPRGPPAASPGAEGAFQMGVGFEEIAAGTALVGAPFAEEAAEPSEVVFGIVDGVGGFEGGRPAELGGGGAGGSFFHPGEVGEAAFGGAPEFEGVEGGYAGAADGDVEAGEGGDQAGAGGAGGGLEEEALAEHTLVFEGEAAGEGAAEVVEQEGVFEGGPGEEAFGEAGDEDDVEGAAAGFLDGADEDFAVARPAGFGAERAEAIAENGADLVEGDGSDLGHGAELAEDGDHGFGVAEGASGEDGEAVEPVAPHGAGGPSAEEVDEGEGEAAEVFEAEELALVMGAARVGFLGEGGEAQAVVPFESPEAALPAVAAADDGGVHEELFPDEGRLQGSGDDGFVLAGGRGLGRGFFGLGGGLEGFEGVGSGRGPGEVARFARNLSER